MMFAMIWEIQTRVLSMLGQYLEMKKIPYPRRCRTGRPPTDTDMHAESRVEKPLPIYVPRDEQFEESKRDAFSTRRRKTVLRNFVPSLISSLSADNSDFKGFSEFDSSYKEGFLQKLGLQDEILKKLSLSKLVSKIKESSEGLLRFHIPKIVSNDKFAWLWDEEFAHQAIIGINPGSIERLKVFTPVSKLDLEIYGPLESALKEEHILGRLNGMSVQQALDENKLFMLDYHDAYLPFMDRINALDGRNSYATRTLFFLTPLGTLKPMAIELSNIPLDSQTIDVKNQIFDVVMGDQRRKRIRLIGGGRGFV